MIKDLKVLNICTNQYFFISSTGQIVLCFCFVPSRIPSAYLHLVFPGRTKVKFVEKSLTPRSRSLLYNFLGHSFEFAWWYQTQGHYFTVECKISIGCFDWRMIGQSRHHSRFLNYNPDEICSNLTISLWRAVSSRGTLGWKVVGRNLWDKKLSLIRRSTKFWSDENLIRLDSKLQSEMHSGKRLPYQDT